MENKQEFQYQNKASLLRQSIQQVIVGKTEVIDRLMTCLLGEGHVLLEDVPGTGKTLLAKTLAKSLEGRFERIQFTPDLLPSDITGINFYHQKEEKFIFRKGPVFGNIILADEINRATPRTQSSLLECMEEQQVTVDGETRILDRPFLVMATQNPVETAGTFSLPEAQMDRFMMKLSMGYPNEEEELQIIDRFLTKNPLKQVANVCTKEDILRMQMEARNVFIHPSLKEYIVRIVQKSRNFRGISVGISPRGTITMIHAVRAFAYLLGRTYVTPEDIQELAGPVFAHRLVQERGLHHTENKTEILQQIVESIEVPIENWE